MSRRGDIVESLNHPRAWLALALLLFATVDLQRNAQANAGIDFYQFWLVAQLSRMPQTPDVYEPAVQRSVGAEALRRAREHGGREAAAAEFNAHVYPNLIEPTATPMLYVASRAFVSGDYERDLTRFQLVSNLAAIVALVVLARLSGFEWIDAVLAGGVVAICVSPIRDDLNHANTARLQLPMLCVPLIVIARWRRNIAAEAIAGALLGLAVMYKPNIAAAALLLLVPRVARRDLKGAAALAVGMLGGAAMGFGIGSIGFGGAAAWPAWWRALRAIDYPLEMGNCGGGRVIADLTGVPYASVVIFVIAMIACAVIIWRLRADDLFAIAAGCLVMLVSSSLAWVHYYVLAIPMGLYLLRPGEDGATRTSNLPSVRRGVACLALAMMARIPLQAAIGATSQRQLAGGYVIAALALLILALCDRPLSSRPRPT